MEKRWDAYLAVALDGDDVEIQVDGHAGDIAQIAAIAQAMAKLKENTNTGCFGDCATCSGAAVDDRAGTGSRPQDADDGLPS